MVDLNSNSKWLTLLVYILLTVLTVITGWSTVGLSALKDRLPKEFVRLERYLEDAGKLSKQLDKIDQKLDRLIFGPTRGDHER